MKFSIALCSILFALVAQHSCAQKQERKGEFYGSWGYNTEAYTKSTISISQPLLGNNYQMHNVTAQDHAFWTTTPFWQLRIDVPQFSVRFGYFFNHGNSWGVELNYDHAKYVVNDNQKVLITGTQGGQPIPAGTFVNFASPDFYYYLNNGANFWLINLVRRQQLYELTNKKLKFDLLGKVGFGPTTPHVQNQLYGNPNYPPGTNNLKYFQIGGWNTAVEVALRSTFYKYVYLEVAGKLDYARYSNLHVYEGTAKQSFGAAEFIINIGFTIPAGKKITVATTPTAS